MLLASSVAAQTPKWQDLYKVKKKDTIYGIAQKFGITIDELMQANPDMQKNDYVLKKESSCSFRSRSRCRPLLQQRRRSLLQHSSVRLTR